MPVNGPRYVVLARPKEASSTMSQSPKRGAKPIAELIGASLDPLVRKRGLARTELLSWWPHIVGAAYAEHTAPERIRWTRDGTAATLVVRCDPSMALQLAHETDRVRERLNAYFGYAAVGAVRIVQYPVGRRDSPPVHRKPAQELPIHLEKRIEGLDEPLRKSVAALARGVLARS
jgi:hypothetical protein